MVISLRRRPSVRICHFSCAQISLTANLIAHLQSTWRSSVYDHFHAPTIVCHLDGHIMHKFMCRSIHPTICVSRADYEDSTSNLKRHIELCEPMDTPEAQTMQDFAHGVTYSWPQVRYLIAMWCVCSHCPFSIVEDREFQKLLQMLYLKIRLPSHFTIARDIRVITDSAETSLIKLFKVSTDSLVHLCVDGWTSPNVFSYLGITVHWHHQASIHHVLLDYVQ
ncbi:hypothetical protein L227DRAFT_514796 [Lentinus tigrinus ALCF2SS1-6]|uniref:HAT C-terminal dimerisation domain-containing protein n=1 Tax=Lentinus tigrinus ALCF2SS1-6 TaxID=1328759 RepID=A0A5C2RLK3_9APHY|nr:hypothetical protein L227DRAFT_514796 [Lentinus tigrinus ALCF2SS1-6]